MRELTEPGIHRVEVLHEDWSVAPELSFAVNPSLSESDFLPVSAERISEALGGESERDVPVLVGANAQIDPFQLRGYASLLLAALCLLFAAESLLASRG